VESSRIAWLAGDGPGAELVEAARRVFDALAPGPARHETGSIGWTEWLEHGECVPTATLELCSAADAVLVGAVARAPESGDPKRLQARLAADLPETGPDPLIILRRALGLGLQITECRFQPGEGEPFELAILTPELPLLAGGERLHPVADNCLPELVVDRRPYDWTTLPGGQDLELAIAVLSRETCQAALRQAFVRARQLPTPAVTVVVGRGASPIVPGLLRKEARQLSHEFLDVQLREADAPAVCAGLLSRPASWGVLVCSPGTSDTVTAVAAHRSGGAGLVATSFLGETRACFTPLEPASRAYAGYGGASPVAVLEALRQLLAFLGRDVAAARLGAALAELLARGPRTIERGGDASTAEVTRFVIERL
jgi:3-isopropylmalate dehydrogenase